jgi:AraC-like DNA-binding protein
MSLLLPVFRDKLIPWAETGLDQRLVVAQSVMKKADVPYGVELTRRKIPGKRVIVRKRYSGRRVIHAVWPEAELHEQENFKLVCVIKGTTDFIAGNYCVTCGEGHFILLPPFTPNTTGERAHLEGERRKNGYCELLQISVDRDTVNISYCVSRGETHQDIPTKACSLYHQQALRLFNEFTKETVEGGLAERKLQGHLLSACFLLLQKELLAGHEIHCHFMPAHTPSVISSIDEINDYIKAHLDESLTIEKVARRMYISPRQLTRYLRQETGRTFVEIHTAYRIAEAKRLLRETQWSVAGVAIFLGFKSVTYFNAFFTRNVGCTPGVFRHREKKGKFVLK